MRSVVTILVSLGVVPSTSVCGEFNPFGVAQPIAVLIQSDPSALAIGEETPRVAVYKNGEVIFLKQVNKRAVYHHVRLDEAALDRFLDQIKPVLALNRLERQYNMTPNLTSQPITKFYFHNGEQGVATLVYGLMAPGTRLLAYTELPFGLEPVMPPKELLQLHSRLCQLDYPESQEWTPDYVKVLAWEYSYAPEPSIHWPQKWPSLSSDRTTKNGDGYSIFLDGSTLPELRRFLATRNEKGAIEINGKKMCAEYRFTFPGEPAWRKAFRLAEEPGDKDGG